MSDPFTALVAGSVRLPVSGGTYVPGGSVQQKPETVNATEAAPRALPAAAAGGWSVAVEDYVPRRDGPWRRPERGISRWSGRELSRV